MLTQEKTIETLRRFNISEGQLETWETELGLEIPVDTFGNKVYSPLHINLFKNVKKHLTLGRSISDIKRMIVLPSTKTTASNKTEETSVQNTRQQLTNQTSEVKQSVRSELSQRILKELNPTETNTGLLNIPIDPTTDALPESFPWKEPAWTSESKLVKSPSAIPARKGRHPHKRFSSEPISIHLNTATTGQPDANSGLLILVDKLMSEKDTLLSELTFIEKQNTHLHQANTMFQTRLKEIETEMTQLQEQLRKRENFKLIEDKARLQKQILSVEQRASEFEKQSSQLTQQVSYLEKNLADKIDPKRFQGNWLEEADLTEIVFDNFGINIESKRNRMFKITQIPKRTFGHAAIIETDYEYQTNTLWKRTESLMVSIINDNKLEGELIAEYTLDGTPVARAIYQVRCYRNGTKTD